LNIEVISRLERLEARMRVVESRPNPEPDGLVPEKSTDLTEIEALIREHAEELQTLRNRLNATEEKMAQSAESGQELIVASAGVPAKTDEEFEIRVDARVESMRAEIETDLAKLNRRTVTAIERGVDDRIATRTLPLERAVRSQAKAIDDLRERINLLESHLQRLVGTVERLLDRPPQPAVAPAAPAEQPSFRTYLDHAVNNDPIPPPPSVDPLFRPRIIKEDENRSASAPRRPLSPLR
jgi:chromosome segregation ATPase